MIKQQANGLESLILLQGDLVKLSQALLAGTYLTFHLGEQWCGVRLGHVRCVLAASKILPLEGMPNHVRGVMLANNRFVPVLDFQLPNAVAAPAGQTHVILMRLGGPTRIRLDIGLLVDSAPVLKTFTPADVHPTATVARANLREFVMGGAREDDRPIALLAMTDLMSDTTLSFLAERIAALGKPASGLWRFHRARLQADCQAN